MWIYFGFCLGDLSVNFVDNANVTELFFGFNQISNYIDRDLVTFRRSVQDHSLMILQISDAISDVHQSLDYFIHVQDLLLSYESRAVSVLVTENDVMLMAGAYRNKYGVYCSNSTLFKSNISNASFEEYSKVIFIYYYFF